MLRHGQSNFREVDGCREYLHSVVVAAARLFLLSGTGICNTTRDLEQP